MKPDREKRVGRNLIEEYYWAGKWVVYVNNKRYDGTYEEAVKWVESGGLESSYV